MNTENVIGLLTVTNIGTAVIAFYLWRALCRSKHEIFHWQCEREIESGLRIVSDRVVDALKDQLAKIHKIVAPTEGKS